VIRWSLVQHAGLAEGRGEWPVISAFSPANNRSLIHAALRAHRDRMSSGRP
jgi:hypothetical protein